MMTLDTDARPRVKAEYALPRGNSLECGRYGGPWFVASVEWGQEDLARGECRQRGLQTFHPLVRINVPCRDGRTRRELRPAFPGYLLILLADDADWRDFKRCRGFSGVLHAVGDREKPATVDPYVVGWWLQHASPTGVIEELSVPPRLPEIEPGTQLRVTHGALAGGTGVCQWSAAERVAILMQLLGGPRRVEVEKRYVETVEATEGEGRTAPVAPNF